MASFAAKFNFSVSLDYWVLGEQPIFWFVGLTLVSLLVMWNLFWPLGQSKKIFLSLQGNIDLIKLFFDRIMKKVLEDVLILMKNLCLSFKL